MPKIANRVLELWNGTGTGDPTLPNTAVEGYQRWSDAFTSADVVFYCIALESEDEWEVGIGTFLESGGPTFTLQRTTVLSGSNGTSAVNFSAGEKRVFCVVPAERVPGLPIDQQDFSSSGTWTKPPGARLVRVRAVGAGGGGGSGWRDTATNVAGGGGGGGGEGVDLWFEASQFAATVAVGIGAGGTGGSGTASGNAGTPGGHTTFGDVVLAMGGEGGTTGNATSNPGGHGGGLGTPATFSNPNAGIGVGRSRGRPATGSTEAPNRRSSELGGGAGGIGASSTGSSLSGSHRNKMGGFSVRGAGGGGGGGSGSDTSGLTNAGRGGLSTYAIAPDDDFPDGGGGVTGDGANGAGATDFWLHAGAGGEGGQGVSGSGTVFNGGSGGAPGGGGGAGGSRKHTTLGGGNGGDGANGWLSVRSYA
jgi:hypothetical protein